ncbi:MAG: YidC/Oxa1 family membrane protein insertase [Clostridia bacterium]|nr:YidC/Oxa1 family membrane protein insertase [Clostridia bacterium]
MGGILSAIGLLFGKLMYFIYNTIGFHNYALSIIFFTLVYRLILLPLTTKQMKSSQKMQELQPELARIQERYKNDREKLNEETMKFYQEKGYNPASGCLPLLIQMPIIIALFYVIRMPMSYMLEIPAKAVGEMAIVSVQNGTLDPNIIGGTKVFDQIKNDPTEAYKKFSQKDYYIEIKLMDEMNRKPELLASNAYLSDQQRDVLKNFRLKMFGVFNFGIPPTLDFKKLTTDPATNVPPLLLLLLAVATTYLTSLFLMPKPQPTNNKKDKASMNQGCANKSMLWISPLMTLWIGLTTPSGLSFYWFIQNILTFIQQKALNKIYKKDPPAPVKEENSVAKVNNKRS